MKSVLSLVAILGLTCSFMNSTLANVSRQNVVNNERVIATKAIPYPDINPFMESKKELDEKTAKIQKFERKSEDKQKNAKKGHQVMNKPIAR